LASIGAALVLFLAPFCADFYGAPEMTGLAAVVAIATPLTALSTIPLTKLRVSLDFRLLATVGTVEVLASQSLSVLFAFSGMGPYSFVVPLPIVAALKTIWLWAIVRPRMFRTRPRQTWLYLVKSGIWVWSYRLLNGFIDQGPYFVLGLFTSPQEVGLYFFAFRLSVQPLQALANNFWTVFFPVLSQLRSRPQEQTRVALRASEALVAITFFGACLQVVLAAPVLHLLFHDRWNGSIPLIQVLSLALSFNSLPWIAGALLDSRGQFQKTLVCITVAVPWFFVLIGLGAWLYRAPGVAIAVGIYFALFGPIYSYVAMRDGGTGLLSVLRLYFRPAMVAGSAVFVADCLVYLLYHGNSLAIRIIVVVILAAGFYAGLLCVWMPGTFTRMSTAFRKSQ
jgi:O-antigen/teichoic acid export membrane protein